MNLLIKILFHLLPLYPLLTKKYFLLVGAVLFVALPYIKTQKLLRLLEEQKKNGVPEREIASTQRALNLMRYLAFSSPAS